MKLLKVSEGDYICVEKIVRIKIEPTKPRGDGVNIIAILVDGSQVIIGEKFVSERHAIERLEKELNVDILYKISSDN